MKTRRIIAALVGLLLLAGGVGGTIMYANAADQRAMASLEPQVVLVAKAPIPKGTQAEGMGALVERQTLPTKAIVPSAVSSLDQIATRVASTDLVEGEQILDSRFVDPATLSATQAIKIPKGLQQISVVLDNQRVLGGRIIAGNKVGVFISTSDDGKRTHLVLNRALVTDIRSGEAASDNGEAPQAAASGTLTVTFALSAADSEKVVWAATNGTLWLALQGPDTDTSNTDVVTAEKVLNK